jgi:hypothetical protein
MSRKNRTAGPQPGAYGATAYPPGYPPPPVKGKHRVFPWLFLLANVGFLIWLIAGIAGGSSSGADAHAQAIAQCSGNQWQGLFKSYQDCVTHYGNGLNAASDVGKGIGAALIIGLWVAFDVIVGGIYLVFRLATRNRQPQAAYNQSPPYPYQPDQPPPPYQPPEAQHRGQQ